MFKKAEQKKKPSKAYDIIDNILYSCNDIDLINYLKNNENKWRYVLLSCMADHEIEIKDNLLEIIYNLLNFNNRDIVRSAALALEAGGEEARTKLITYIKNNNPYNIKELIWFINYKFKNF